MSAQVGCPHCGSKELYAWYLDPVKYGVHDLHVNDEGKLEYEYDGTDSEMGEGGELDDFSCPNCSAVGITASELEGKGPYPSAAEKFARAQAEFTPAAERELTRIVRETIPDASKAYFGIEYWDDGPYLTVLAVGVPGGYSYRVGRSEDAVEMLATINERAGAVLSDLTAVHGTNLDELELPE